jgi:curli biogenesis system outer membrane secretion channel CsgG
MHVPPLIGADGAASSARADSGAHDVFDYSTVTTKVNYWFNNNTNIGEGIRSMLTVRFNGSKNLTMLERTNLNTLMSEQELGASNRVRKGTNANIGQLSGADVNLMGDIVIFGRDDTAKRKGLGAAIGRFSPIRSAAAAFVHGEGTRRWHQTFRGLLGLHSRYGPYAC